jgi:hypothetical protein
MKFCTVWFTAILLHLSVSNSAQDLLVVANNDTPPATLPASEPSEDPSAAPPETGSGLSFSGYFDLYYFANLNRPASRNNLGSSGIARGFDRNAGQFQLGVLMTRLDYRSEMVDLVAEVGFGPNAEYGSYGSDFRYQWGTVVANTTYSAILIKQAYIDVRAGDRLTFTAGQFGTHIGYEYIDSPLNFHYSINNMFNAGIPFYHLGLKATYAVSEKVKAMAGVVNGTDNINDNNRGKSAIAQIAFVPSERWSVYLNTIQGNEANARSNGADTASYFGIIDLVTSYRLSSRLSAALWLMRGTQSGEFQGSSYLTGRGHWQGASLYLTYRFSDRFSLGSRLEYFDNSDGVRALRTQGLGTRVGTLTLTGDITLADGRLKLKPEFRLDDFQKMPAAAGETDTQQFMDAKGNFSLHTQSTAGLAAVFKF